MKKKKVVLYTIFIVLFTNINIQGKDNYNKLIDSLLITLGQKIENDLALNGYNIPKHTLYDIQLVGSSIILEVFYSSKKSYILTLYGTTGSMYDKYFKQTKGFNFRKRLIFHAFRRFMEENNEIPFDCLKYKFLTLYNESPRHHAIYGEYLFKVDDDEVFEISEKKIEVLQSRDEIMRKYKLEF